jgi:hypothetical protein
VVRGGELGKSGGGPLLSKMISENARSVLDCASPLALCGEQPYVLIGERCQTNCHIFFPSPLPGFEPSRSPNPTFLRASGARQIVGGNCGGYGLGMITMIFAIRGAIQWKVFARGWQGGIFISLTDS